MTVPARSTGGAQGGRLLVAAGLLTLANNYLPGSGHLDLPVLNTIGLAAVALGLLALRLPWDRMHPRAPLALAPLAFALISLSNLFGEVSAFSYAVYFVVVFVWVGIAQPPRTSWWLLPFAAVAYLLPFLLREPPPTAVASVTVALPVCLLVGEVLARTVLRLEQSQQALHERVLLVERLAQRAPELAADLDAPLVQRRLTEVAAELFGATGAMVLAVGPQSARVIASTGRAPAGGTQLPRPPGGALARVAAGLCLHTAGARELGLDEDGPAVLALVRRRPGPDADGDRGGTAVLCLRLPDGAALRPEDLDVLRLLVAQGAAALGNAAAHTVVVDQRAHEQAVVDVLADGVLVLDACGRVVSCNEMAADLLGGSRAGLVGTVLPLPVGTDGAPVHASVGTRWIETVATALARGERVVTMRDISRQRAVDEARDLFLATTSHELRTPLTAVQGYVQMLRRKWDVLDEQTRRAALETVAERTEALVALTNHLLLGAHAGASRHSTPRVPFDLAAAVARTASGLVDLSPRHPLRVELGEPRLLALGDPASVTHLLGQLVENAIKFSPRGGPVDIRMRRDGDWAVVEVADEGVGLPEGAELSLFAPFFQAAPPNTRRFGGVGLGLYIVRQLVEGQGGTVLARNRAGRGAVVGFRLPLAPLPAPPVPRSGGPAPATSSRPGG